MATELNNLHLFIDADARLAAAAGGVAAYLAEAAGLEDDAVARLQSAVVAACNKAFEHLSPEHPRLEVIFVRFPDRLEIALSQGGGAGLPGHTHSVAATAADEEEGSSAQLTLPGVDHVQYETHGPEIITRLTKYLGKVAPKI